MKPTSRWAHSWLPIALPVLLWSIAVAAVPSIPLTYCATVNTGTTNANHSIYQSDGLCHDFCRDNSYSIAVIQADTCWCSNKAPDKKSQVSMDDCSTPCPGFPDDLCGGDGVYAYMVVESVPGSRPTPTGRPGQTSGPTAPPVPTVQTVTADGTVRTVTVTPTSGVTAPNQANITSQSGLGVGASVGIAIGVISAAVLAGVVAFCVWRRRRQREDEGKGIFHSPSPRGSSAGMTGSPKVAEAGMTPPFAGRVTEGTYESDHSGRRRSFLMPIDPRIDPAHGAIYNRDGNKSHESVNTLRDDQDYSRRVHQPAKVLRATNPDPDDD